MLLLLADYALGLCNHTTRIVTLSVYITTLELRLTYLRADSMWIYVRNAVLGMFSRLLIPHSMLDRYPSCCVFFFFFLMIRRPPRSPLFPSPTLFRSAHAEGLFEEAREMGHQARLALAQSELGEAHQVEDERRRQDRVAPLPDELHAHLRAEEST